MRCFVTGGAGFIGSHLVDALKDKGHEVFIYDLRDGFDIDNYSTLSDEIKKFHPSVVYHLAAISGTSETFKNPRRAVITNVLGTLTLLECLKNCESNATLIYPSKPHVGRNPYTITKVTAEELIQMFHETYGLKTIIFRPHIVYGPGQLLRTRKAAVPTFVIKALRNKLIPVYGGGEQSFDWIYVDDVVEAFLLALESERAIGEWMDIGTGKVTSVNDVVNMILEISESESKIEYLSMRAGEGSKYLVADTSKAEKLLGFRAKTSLWEGLKKTVEYYRRVVQ